MIKLFEVGGHIRDHLMGVESNDIDYAVEAKSYEAMKAWIESTHSKIFLETPDKFTIRALKGRGDVRDYVLCRKEGPYTNGRSPDWVKPGTFEDDILRRDFSINGLAREVGTNKIIDIVGGIDDVAGRKLRCIGSAHDRFEEDSLRVIRAIRFIVTKGFKPDDEIMEVFSSGEFAGKLSAVSANRRRDEMLKCMKFHTPELIQFLGTIHPSYTKAIFEDGLWLLPTMKER